MGTQAGNDDGAAIPVESRIVYERDLRRHVKAAHDVGGIVGLAHGFSSVVKRAVTQHEADPSEGQVLAMVASKAAVHESASDAIILPVPGVAGKISPRGDGAVYLAEGEGFEGTVVPASAQVDAEVTRKVLLEVNGEARLHRALVTVQSDVRLRILAGKVGLVGLVIVAQVSTVDEKQRPHVRRVTLQCVICIIELKV